MAAHRGGHDLSSRQAVRAAERHHVGPPLRDDRVPPVRLRLRAADAERPRSTVYVNAKYHPSGKAGWFTKPNPKNGDWRRFAISKQMCQAVQEHIEEYGLGPDDLLFPQWMFAYVRSALFCDDDEYLPPLVSKAGIVYEHGTKGARYSMNCHCRKCKAYAADYQRQWRRQQSTQQAGTGEPGKANSWRQDGTEFLMAEVWLRFWNAARDAAGLPEGFTPYNARHTGISWAIDKGVDLQKVRQRAGHGSLEVTSRYAAILDERDTSLAETLEESLTVPVRPEAATRIRQSSMVRPGFFQSALIERSRGRARPARRRGAAGGRLQGLQPGVIVR